MPETAYAIRSFNLIVCAAENRVIGDRGRLPWSIPEDRLFLRRQTAGQVIVLGRICFQSWPDAAREGRRPVVVTSNAALATEGVRVAGSLPAALAAAAALPGDIYVCGGQRIFSEAIDLPEATRLYLTLVHATVDGDRVFPDWRGRFTREVARRESGDARWRYAFLTLEK